MTTAERLACLRDALNSNNRELSVLYEANNVLQVEQQRLWKKAIEEDGMIAGPWKFNTFRGSNTVLDATTEMVCKLDKLGTMLVWHYHESFHLNRTDCVRVDDGHYSLVIRTKNLATFCAKYGVTVRDDMLKEEITNLEAQIAGIRETLEQIKSA